MLTQFEQSRLSQGLAGTGGYFDRCFAIAKHAFLGGHSLDKSIRIARQKFGF